MFKSAVTVVATFAMLFASASFAQQTNTTGSDTVGQIQVNSRSGYKLAPREIYAYAYTYDLSTGDSIRLRETVGRYFVNLNNGADVEVFGQGPGVFLSSTGARFEFRDAGETVLVTNLGALPGARPVLAAAPAEATLTVYR